MSERRPVVRQRQLELTLCHLIRAMTVSHARVRRFAALRIALSVTLAVAGLGTVFAGSVNSSPVIRSVSITVTVAGALWALVRRDRSLLRVAYPFGPFLLLGALLGVLLGDVVAVALGWA